MISTKGYFYSSHQNPQHNVRFRRLKNPSMQSPLAELKYPKNEGKQCSRVQGIVGNSQNKRFNQNQKKVINISFNRYPKKIDQKLTFQKLQKILSQANAQTKNHNKKQICRQQIQQQPTQMSQFLRKNTKLSEMSTGFKTYSKYSKNRQFKQCIFNSETKRTRPQSNISYLNYRTKSNFAVDQSNSVQQTYEQSIISPSQNGVFIPSTKFKYSSQSSRRYKTSYNT